MESQHGGNCSCCIRVPGGVVCLGSPSLKIIVGSKVHWFEDHRVFGPIRTRKNGDVLDKQWEPHDPFYRAYRGWCEQGKKVDAGGCCVYEMPKPHGYWVKRVNRDHFHVVPEGTKGAKWHEMPD